METPSIHCSLHLKSRGTFCQLECHFHWAIQLRVGRHLYLNAGVFFQSATQCEPYHTLSWQQVTECRMALTLVLDNCMVSDFVSLEETSIGTTLAASLSAAVEMISSELLVVGSFCFTSARSDFISLWLVCTLLTADLQNKVDVTCPCIPPFLHAELITVDTRPDYNLPPFQDKSTWALLLSYSSLEDSTTWHLVSFMYNPKYENKEDDNTTRTGLRISVVLCSLTLMTVLSTTFVAFLYSSIVIFAKTPEWCAFAMVIPRRIKSLTFVYMDWLTCKV